MIWRMMGFVVAEFQERVSWGRGRELVLWALNSRSTRWQDPRVRDPQLSTVSGLHRSPGSAVPRSFWARRQRLKSQAGS